jgi:hypothetical protein
MQLALATGWEPDTVRALTLDELAALGRAMRPRSAARPRRR